MFRLMFAALCGVASWCAVVAHAESVRAAERVTVEDAVRRAVAASPTLKSRDELVSGAQAGIRQSDVLPNPEASVELENFGGSGDFQDLDEAEMTLGVSQRIELGGKRSGRVAVAEAERDIAAIELDKTMLDVVVEARRAFYEVAAAAALLKVRKGALDTAREVQVMATRRVHSARDPATVRLRAEIQFVEARGAHERAQVALEAAQKKLASLWGDGDATFTVDESALFAIPAESGEVDLLASPELKASEAMARRAASRTDLEIANGVPDVSVGLGVRRFERGGDLAGIVSLSVPLAIFDTNQGSIDRAAAERRAADLDVIETRRSAERNAATIQTEFRNARTEAVALRSELLPRAEEASGAARRGYDAGAFSYYELFESTRTLNELRVREIEVLREMHSALAGLDRLAGRARHSNSDQGQEK